MVGAVFSRLSARAGGRHGGRTATRCGRADPLPPSSSPLGSSPRNGGASATSAGRPAGAGAKAGRGTGERTGSGYHGRWRRPVRPAGPALIARHQPGGRLLVAAESGSGGTHRQDRLTRRVMGRPSGGGAGAVAPGRTDDVRTPHPAAARLTNRAGRGGARRRRRRL